MGMPNAARGTFWKGACGTSQANWNSLPIGQKFFSTLHAPHQVAEIVSARQGHESTRAFRLDFVVRCLRQKLLVRRGLA